MSANTFAATDALTRRRFLRNSGLALASSLAFPALIPAPAIGRAGAVAPSNRVQLGVVGAKQGHFNWQRCRFANVQTVAVCEVDSNRRHSFVRDVNQHHKQKGTKDYGDFREMFAKAKLDAVILAAPDHWHGAMSVAAARAGISIWGEKPLAHTIWEGRAIVKAVAQHGVAWQTGSWQRSLPYFRHICELVRNGRIGKVQRVEVGTGGFSGANYHSAGGSIGSPPASLDYDTWVGPATWRDYHPGITHYNWRLVLNFGGGPLMDWVGHYYDIAQWALGLDHTGPVKITGTGTYARPTPELPYDAETSYRYDCEYADGVVISGGSDYASGTRFFGEGGKWLHVQRNRPLRASDPNILRESIGQNETHLYKSDNHWRNFIDASLSRRETVAPAEAGHRAASAGLLGQIAILTGRTIRWDPVKEEILGDPAASALLKPSLRGGWGL
ncbi:MAG: Gfo/Idh/MocA family oxidoreductase [Puniceicoccales bacterium]|jgi:predicted dehydrogenase|nr:Gfo/Idh/MocA family oxidoreductase [Puniceicoccales bacterium]